MRRLAQIGVLASVLALLAAGCTTPPPPSPVTSIPKLLVDYVDNETRLYVSSSNADLRYDNITVALHNDNVSLDDVYHINRSYFLLARTNLTYFEVNASADTDGRFYFYNATMHVVEGTPTPSGEPVWQMFIRESPNAQPRRESLPFQQVLSEGER